MSLNLVMIKILLPTAETLHHAMALTKNQPAGSSSGALGCYLVHHLLPNKRQFLFEQGRAMQCSSLIDVFIDSTAKNVTRVQVGGKATLIGTKIN